MVTNHLNRLCENTKGGSITVLFVDLLFDWFGLVCFANKNKKMSVLIQQTSQTGGQWYSDTSPFSIP
jgi:hypothetical protein